MSTHDSTAAGQGDSARVPLVVAATVLGLVAVSLAREMLSPLLLAAVIVIIVHPVRRPLERRGWPRWLATTPVPDADADAAPAQETPSGSA